MGNSYDVKRRPEVGVKDMDNYEFGGLEVEERLTNGYLMYVPYGIHCDVFGAMEFSTNMMRKHREGLKEMIAEEGTSPALAKVFQERIEEVERHLQVLEKIAPLVHEI